MKTRFIYRAVCIMLAGVAIFLGLIAYGRSSGDTAGTPENIAEVRSRIRGYLQRYTPDIAYNRTKQLYPDTPAHAVFIHAALHIFGEEVYRKYGLEGVSYCDNSYVYGCYHGVFSQAIIHGGEQVMPGLFSRCRKLSGNYRACEHGIGHGVLDYLGSGRLSEALEMCVRSGAMVIPFGCVGGVFMEYNFPAFSTNGTANVRPFNSEDPTAPCSSLPRQYYSSCIFRLTEWWEVALAGDYVRIGRLCSEVRDSEARRFCFIGIGSSLTVTGGYNTAKAADYCNVMPDGESRSDCSAGIVWEFRRNKKEVDSVKICASENRCDQSIRKMTGWVGDDFIRD